MGGTLKKKRRVALFLGIILSFAQSQQYACRYTVLVFRLLTPIILLNMQAHLRMREEVFVLFSWPIILASSLNFCSFSNEERITHGCQRQKNSRSPQPHRLHYP